MNILQKAMRKFIEINRRKLSLGMVEAEIDKIKKAEIERAEKEQMVEYDKEMYFREGIRY